MFNNIPCCGECVHATIYIPYWNYPFSDPLCEITGKHVKSDDVCCEFFESSVLESKNCKCCGMNISDLDDDYCEYCK